MLFRSIIENMYKTASVADWNKKHGKHKVYAGGHDVQFESDFVPSLVLNSKDVARVRVHDDNVAETAADEERMARAKAREEEKKMKRMMDELTFGRNLGNTEAGELVKIELAQRKAETVNN